MNACVSSDLIPWMDILNITHLYHGITLDVVLESLELKVEYRREGLEDDTLLRFLQAVALSHVLVFTIQGLDSNIILEGLIEVLHTLHVQLNVLSRQ